MRATLKLGLAALVLAGCASVSGLHEAAPEQGPVEAENPIDGATTETTALWFTRVYKDIKLSAAQGTLARLERAMEEVQQHWVLGRRTMHLEAMLVLCWELHEMRSDDPERQLGLLLKCAETLFEKEPLVPPETQILVVKLLIWATRRHRAALSQDFWEDLRRRTARLILHTWKRLSEAVDPDYDYLDKPLEEVTLTPELLGRLPFENICPPVGGGPSGIAPECIPDPVLRRRYEEALAENERKLRAQNMQSRVRRLLEESSRRAEEYLVDLYGTQPFDIQELRDLLEEYGLDREVAAKILDAVRAAEGASQKTPDE